jgi:hypothetical protein
MATDDEIRTRYRYKDAGELGAIHASPTLTDDERTLVSKLLSSRERGAARVAAAHTDADRKPPIMGTVGALLMLLGLYLLVVSPDDPIGDDLLGGRGVVNLQRLFIGQAATIAGAIFIAAEWLRR